MRIRLTVVTLLLLFLSASAQAGIQLYEGSWTIKAFGNDRTTVSGEPVVKTGWGIPLGIQCNAAEPRCEFASTPTKRTSTLGGGWEGTFWPNGEYCTPLTQIGAGFRPDHFGSTTTPGAKRGGPRYRNPAFFTTDGQPNPDECEAEETVAQKGKPITGIGVLRAPVPRRGRAFTIYAADAADGGFQSLPDGRMYPGMRGKRTGEFAGAHPYLYSYTYADLQNHEGYFGYARGLWSSFSRTYGIGKSAFASIMVERGKNKFGGTMAMLGALTHRTCWWMREAPPGQCSLGAMDWRYEMAGTYLDIDGKGFTVTAVGRYSHTQWGTYTSAVLKGYRFPWTTGMVTVSAPTGVHNTFQKGTGYDNREPGGEGTIQLVTPLLTLWQGFDDEYTGGVGFLKIKFLPEPGAGLALASGAGLLFVLARRKKG